MELARGDTSQHSSYDSVPLASRTLSRSNLLKFRTVWLYFGCGQDRIRGFRVTPELKLELQRIADDEQRALSQVCEMLLYEGVVPCKIECHIAALRRGG